MSSHLPSLQNLAHSMMTHIFSTHFQMREKYRTVIRKAMPFLISNLDVDVTLLSFVEDHGIFVQDVVDEIEVSLQ